MKTNAIKTSFLAAALAATAFAKPSGIHPAYSITSIRPASLGWAIGDISFFSNGDLALTSWRDPYGVFIIKNATTTPGPGVMTEFASGLTETLGMEIVNDTIFIMQKDELTALIDHDNDGKADEYRTIANRFSKSTMEKEYAGGLAYDGTYFYS